MDLTNATLESGYNFHRFHEELNRVLKINVIALWIFRQQLAAGLTADKVKEQIYENGMGELWGGMPSWKDPDQALNTAKYDLGNNGVVRVFSAFDVYMDTLEGELESWNSFNEKKAKDSVQKAISKGKKAEDEKDVDKFFKLMARKNWGLEHEEEIKTIYTYYRLSRNCIVHRNGLASTALAENSNSDKLKETIDAWPRITSDKTVPPVHNMNSEDPIRFTHRDAIFASSITRSMALYLNKLAINEIGEEGVIYMLAQKYILKENIPTQYLRFESVSKSIAFILRESCRITNSTQHDVKPILITLGIFDECKKKFRKLKVNMGIA